jgi:hypothetical protein
MKLHATLELTGRTSTGFRIPDELVEALGGGGRPTVTVTVNGASWRSSIARMGGEYWLGASAANRELTGISAGNSYDLDIELDIAPRVVEVPDDLAAALAADPAAKGAFDRLSYSHQRQHVEAILDAKKEETRRRRVDKSLAVLRGEA